MRAKIIFPHLLALLLVGVGGYLFLSSALAARSDEALKQNLPVVAGLFDRAEAMRGYEQLAAVRRLSMGRAVSDVFQELDVQMAEGETREAFDRRIRDTWFRKTVQAVETVASELMGEGRKSAIVFITDRNGVVLARNTTPNACPAGRNVAHGMDVVQKALDGEANFSIWSVDGSPFDNKSKGEGHLCSMMSAGLLEFSAAPVWGRDDQVAGVLAVGFEVSNGAAAEKAASIAMELAVIHAGEVYSTSLMGDTARQHLNKVIKGSDVALRMRRAFSSGAPSEVFPLTVGTEQYLAVAAPVSTSSARDAIGYLFMESVDGARSYTKPLYVYLLIVALGVLLVIVIGYLLGNYFMKPVMAIEEGLLKIINGEYDYRFDVESAEVGGLSYRINQLVNVFTDQEESSEDET